MAKRKQVKIEVTNRGAVYVNGTRITGRDTKWGIHSTVFETTAPITQVAKALADNGYGHIKLDADYLEEIGAA